MTSGTDAAHVPPEGGNIFAHLPEFDIVDGEILPRDPAGGGVDALVTRPANG